MYNISYVGLKRTLLHILLFIPYLNYRNCIIFTKMTLKMDNATMLVPIYGLLTENTHLKNATTAKKTDFKNVNIDIGKSSTNQYRFYITTTACTRWRLDIVHVGTFRFKLFNKEVVGVILVAWLTTSIIFSFLQWTMLTFFKMTTMVMIIKTTTPTPTPTTTTLITTITIIIFSCSSL